MSAMRNSYQGTSSGGQGNMGANISAMQQNITNQQSSFGKYGNFNMQQKSVGVLGPGNKLVIALCRRPYDDLDEETEERAS